MKTDCMKIQIIGRGNVATHLVRALSPHAQVTQVNPRTLAELSDTPDMTVISVSDNAIADIAGALTHLHGTVAHTSGSTPLSVLTDAGIRHAGVFYPLQTFTKDAPLDYSDIPFFIEASDAPTLTTLMETARLISHDVHEADSTVRARLHLASVFACNFVNHLWCMADDLLHESGLDFKTLRPLVRETLHKLDRLSPFEAQTGPAVRQDTKVLDYQKQQLSDNRERLDIYTLISDSIMNKHPKK